MSRPGDEPLLPMQLTMHAPDMPVRTRLALAATCKSMHRLHVEMSDTCRGILGTPRTYFVGARVFRALRYETKRRRLAKRRNNSWQRRRVRTDETPIWPSAFVL